MFVMKTVTNFFDGADVHRFFFIAPRILFHFSAKGQLRFSEVLLNFTLS